MKNLLLRYLLVHYYQIYKFIINVYTFFKVGRWGGQFNGAACEMDAIPEKGGGGGEMRGGRMPPCASSPCPPASRPPLVVPTSLGLVFLRPRFPSSLCRLVPASSCPRIALPSLLSPLGQGGDVACSLWSVACRPRPCCVVVVVLWPLSS